ncbi:hypothetical protein HDU76_011723 [Blyttiomyces sp. JEL0837]|nr:hypothetical protein HDU76_011723 [Blyttiomyces sp. JEL0837]
MGGHTAVLEDFSRSTSSFTDAVTERPKPFLHKIVIPRSPSKTDIDLIQNSPSSRRGSLRGNRSKSVEKSQPLGRTNEADGGALTVPSVGYRLQNSKKKDNASAASSLFLSPGKGGKVATRQLSQMSKVSRDSRVGNIDDEASQRVSVAERYVKALAGLRKTPIPAYSAADKITSFDKVAKLATDLKQVGEDVSLASELDPETLNMVIGLKKWARSIKRQKTMEIEQKRHTQGLQERLELEIPRSIQIDLANDAIPILSRMTQMYVVQLGEKHPYTLSSAKHCRKIKNRAMEGNFTLQDMPSQEQEQAAANAMLSNAKKAQNTHKHGSKNTLSSSHASIRKGLGLR